MTDKENSVMCAVKKCIHEKAAWKKESYRISLRINLELLRTESQIKSGTIKDHNLV